MRSTLDDEVESALHRPVPTGQDGRAQLEQRRALARHVLPSLHEQLGRVGCEPHLDALPVRLLDDLEHGALVEVGLGEDHLVRPNLVEDDRELRVPTQQPEAGDGVGRHDAHELVRQPAPGRFEGGSQAYEALSRADEDDPAANPRRAHHLERRRFVRSPEQPDRDRREDHRRGDQTRGREVVARADPERENDERDDDEAREDPSGTRTQLPPAVEARLREHEHRDRRGELEPLGRALAPQQAPEDVAVAGDELTNDECEVDPQREPGDVEGDERRDGEHAPDDGDDRPAREDVEARGANVTTRSRRCRRRA